MKTDCEIVRDLLPLYVDDICSAKSRELIDEHLEECAECKELLRRLEKTEIEDDLKLEKQDVIDYGVQKFKRLSAKTGITISGLLMIPIIALLIVNLLAGSAMGWFFIVLASLAVAASLIAVPILAPENKLFWTFCAFTVSLLVLLAITCMVSRGDWFWVASSAVLFGLSVCFLPFAIKAKPLQRWVAGRSKALIVLGVDVLLFLNMMNNIRLHGTRSGVGFWLSITVVVILGLIILYLRKKEHTLK